MNAAIYSLSDPRSGDLRYVGSTKNPLRRRLREHCYAAKSALAPVSIWIRELLQQGLVPALGVLEHVSEEFAAARELWWITRSWSPLLLNKKRGGRHAPGAGYARIPDDERGRLRTLVDRDGKGRTAEGIGVSKNTLANVLASLDVNRGTVAQVRSYLSAHATTERPAS